jgi:hypothetical protein
MLAYRCFHCIENGNKDDKHNNHIKMPDYSKGKIYKIVAPDGSHYIGSTIQELKVRFSKHKSDYRRWKHGEMRFTSFELFEKYGIDNCKIELIEIFPCNNRKELELHEGEIIRESINCVNKNIAGRTRDEWRTINCDKISEQKRKYREENRSKIREKDRIYREENNNKIRERERKYREENKDKNSQRYRKYSEENKDKIKEKGIRYRAHNKEKINEKARLKYHERKNTTILQ